MLGQPFSPGGEPAPQSLNAVEEETVIPACSVCGRQDDTLRVASLPYVLSVIVVTFRRAFVGIWCRRHRNIKLIQAGFLSACLGWIGVPYGLIYTPAALWKLAAGGDQPVDSNSRLLKTLAEHKLRQGGVQGAARCLEAVLRLSAEDDDATRRLDEIYRRYPSSIAAGTASTFWPTLALVLMGFTLGGLLGFIDFITTKLSGVFTSMDFLGALLSWIPIIGTVFLGGILLARGVEFAYERMGIRQKAFAILVAVLTAVLALYGIVQGYALAEFLEGFLADGAAGVNSETIRMLGALVTRGGARIIRYTFQSGETVDVIYLVILGIALIFYTGANLSSARRILVWQGRLHTLRPQLVSERAVAFLQGWIAIFAVAVVLTVLGVAFADVPLPTRIGATAASFMDQGDEYLDKGDLEGAARAFEQAAELEPTDAWSRINLGWTYYQLQRYEDAKHAFQEAVGVMPELMEAHLGLGFSASPLGEYSLAQQHFEIVIEGAVDTQLKAQAFYGLAEVYSLLEDYAGANEILEKALELEPEAAYLYVSLGWNQLFLEQYDLALVSFEQALQLEPETIDALFGIGYGYIGQEQYEAARETFLAIIDSGVQGPILASAQLSVGRSSYYAGKYEEATPYYEKALEQEPDLPDAWIELSLAYIWQGEFDTAFAKAQSLVDMQPDFAGGYALKAIVYHFKDQRPLMQEMQEKALELREDDEGVIYLLYFLLSDSQQFALAEALLDEAYEQSDSKEDLLVHLGHLYVNQQKLEQARQAAEELKELEGESSEYHLLLADIASEVLEWDQSLEHLEHALALDEENWRIHSFLSYAFFNLGRTDDALQAAQEAVRLHSYSTSAFKNLAFAYHALGDIDQALQAARESVRLDPKYDLGYYILGLCYEDLGDLEHARQAFTTFLELYWERANVSQFKEHAQAFLEGSE